MELHTLIFCGRRWVWASRKFLSSSIFSGASSTAKKVEATIRGTRRRSNGRRPRRRRTAILRTRRTSYRGPYEYSVPGHATDFTPQERTETETRALKFSWKFLTQFKPRPDTGLYNAKLGIWLFLASEVMLFGGLFSAYILLRVGAPAGEWPHGWLNVSARHRQHAPARALGHHDRCWRGRRARSGSSANSNFSTPARFCSRWPSSASNPTSITTNGFTTKSS